MFSTTLAQAGSWGAMGLLIGIPVAIILSQAMYLITRYKRCPSNRLLVIYGKTGGDESARIIHGGGAIVLPVIQDHFYLSLEPIRVEISMNDVLGGGASGTAALNVAISTEPELMQTAAERLLGLEEEKIGEHAHDIVREQMRNLFSRTTPADFEQQRPQHIDELRTKAGSTLAQLGLEIVAIDIPIVHRAG